MKLILTFVMLLLSWQSFAHQGESVSIQPGTKYGHPTKEELDMTVYPPDTTAVAVMLYNKCNINYDFVDYKLRIVYSYEYKVKVLKPGGTSYANISLTHYENETNHSLKEIVSHIDASAYNMEEGEIVRTMMGNEFVFEERLNNEYLQTKFSIPAVKVGTVFEYKFKIYSDFYFNITPWKAQGDIPYLLSQYDITIPEYFKFNLDIRGGYNLNPKQETTRLTFTHQDPYLWGTSECKGQHLQFTAKELPALHKDNNIWCVNDYLSGVNLELKGIDIPRKSYQSFTQTWNEIDGMLLGNEYFGGMLKISNPFRKEMKALQLDTLPNQQEKIVAIYTLLKKKLSWNGMYSLYGNETRQVIKDQSGSNADINFILMSMLRDADIVCYPVVMSNKKEGVLPLTHPSIQKLNTFVVGITNVDDTYVFLDGSIEYGFINILPPELMVGQARVLDDAGACYWIDLSQIGKNRIHSTIDGQIHPDGKITGSRMTEYTGQYTSSFRQRYHTAKDSADFISKLEEEESIKVKLFQTKEVHDFSPNVKEFLMFEKQATVNGNLIYIHPLVFLHVSKCPFTQSERKLPLEMPFSDQLILTTLLRIPEGYKIEEIPKSVKFKGKDGQSICIYDIVQRNNTVQISYLFSNTKLFYLPNEYPDVKNFWEKITEKNNEMLVLKKI